MKSENTVRAELDAFWQDTVNTDIEPTARMDEVEAILTGITPDTFRTLDATVDYYPYGWLIRRWRNTRFNRAIFA